MRLLELLFAAVLFGGTVPCYAAQNTVTSVLSCQITNVVKEEVPLEGNAEVMKTKEEHPDLGSMVYIYLHNGSKKLVSVKNVSWGGADINTRLQAPDYSAIWWRCSPNTITPGAEAEISVCLRESLKKNTEFIVGFNDSNKIICPVKAEYSGPRLSTITFPSDLKSAFLYVNTAGCGTPRKVYLDGVPVKWSSKLLNEKSSSGLAMINVIPAKSFRQGERHLFRVVFDEGVCASSVRALRNLSRFGTYGGADPALYSAAGYDSYISFGRLDENTLSDFNSKGMKAAMTIGKKSPDTYMIESPAVYGYLALDEPDCGDYSADNSRPMHKRIGTQAQGLVEWGTACEHADPDTPTITTVDLTFAPMNYFVYGKVADISNPDCYTVVLGWPLTAFRDKMSIMKRATAPQPFLATYQAHWEEYVTGLENRWYSADDVAKANMEEKVDRTKLRGFGRAPAPEETRIMMLYAIGSGARGLFGYIDSTEAFSDLLFHGTRSLPEIWQTATKTTRELRVVAPLIELSHPINWCRSDKSSLWVKTLLCGGNAAMVVAVNETSKSEKDAFISSPVNNITFKFPYMPWLKNAVIYKLGDGKLGLVKSAKAEGVFQWNEKSIIDGDIYIICSDKSIADNLVSRYLSKAPEFEKINAPTEGYLKGRRQSPRN